MVNIQNPQSKRETDTILPTEVKLVLKSSTVINFSNLNIFNFTLPGQGCYFGNFWLKRFLQIFINILHQNAVFWL